MIHLSPLIEEKTNQSGPMYDTLLKMIIIFVYALNACYIKTIEQGQFLAATILRKRGCPMTQRDKYIQDSKKNCEVVYGLDPSSIPVLQVLLTDEELALQSAKICTPYLYHTKFHE